MTSDTGAAILVSVGLLLAAACSPNETADDGDAEPGSGRTATVLPTGPGATISIERVSDGDSLRAEGPDGSMDVRLIGINAPEGGECFGDEAKAALAALVDATEIVLQPWPAETDDFGRRLGFLTADGVFVNLAVIESGHAVARAQSDHDYAEAFESAEWQASDAQIGLWAPDACGPPIDAELAIVELQADAPGNDRQNPNGEWIVIANDGASTTEMSGWAIRDESTRHRFAFPELALEPGASVRVRTGCGDDDLDSDPIELHWCDPEPPVWNNGGDTAFLLDPNGGIAAFERHR